jgi:hypothetical protein
VVGTAHLQGRQAIEITWSASPGRLTLTTTVWVDARTYQPMRSVTTTPTGLPDGLLTTATTEYRILPATRANLSLLAPPIPPGFTRVPKSPNF